MSIQPTSPNGPHRALDAAEAERSRTRATESASPAPATSKEAVDPNDSIDSVQVSVEARDLADTAGARPPKNSLPPERLQQIGERLATGFYDRPEVIDQLAQKLAGHPDLDRK